MTRAGAASERPYGRNSNAAEHVNRAKSQLKNRGPIFTCVGLILLLPALLLAHWLSAAACGQMAAEFDLCRGRYALQTYGLLPWADEYSRLLKQRYGIETHAVALCIVSDTVMLYADNYDVLSTAAVNHKFGKDVFNECREDARRNWEHQRALEGSSPE